MDPDHRLLLRNTKPLLQSRSAAVVMAVAQLYFHLAPKAEVGVIAKALVRLLRSHRCVLPAHAGRGGGPARPRPHRGLSRPCPAHTGWMGGWAGPPPPTLGADLPLPRPHGGMGGWAGPPRPHRRLPRPCPAHTGDGWVGWPAPPTLGADQPRPAPPTGEGWAGPPSFSRTLGAHIIPHTFAHSPRPHPVLTPFLLSPHWCPPLPPIWPTSLPSTPWPLSGGGAQVPLTCSLRSEVQYVVLQNVATMSIKRRVSMSCARSPTSGARGCGRPRGRAGWGMP